MRHLNTKLPKICRSGCKLYKKTMVDGKEVKCECLAGYMNPAKTEHARANQQRHGGEFSCSYILHNKAKEDSHE